MTTPNIQLRKTIPEDFDTFFVFQLDEEANQMAAFTPENPHDKEAYMAKWLKNLASERGVMYTIIYNEQIAGSIFTYLMGEEIQLSYWLGKDFWGRGIGTTAANMFLATFPQRPVYGRVAFDNVRSMKVLINNGFRQHSTDKYYSNARKAEIDEVIFILQG